MERSVAAGADILDIDLRMTSDGVIVAIHDRDVVSSTNGRGNVDELTWAELQRLDAAARWTGSPLEGAVRVPSLEQILDRFPDIWMSLELKQVNPPMAGSLCDVLRRTGSVERVYLSANVDAAVYAAHDACPEVLITTTYADLDRMRSAEAGDDDWCAMSPIGQPPYRDGAFDAERVETSHRRGRALFVWTVDDAATLRELAEAGVDGVYTRRPDVAREVFDRLAREAGNKPLPSPKRSRNGTARRVPDAMLAP
jgi:glycerophosphoryl diester phosphodiesterase